jgi:hypothetical protein
MYSSTLRRRRREGRFDCAAYYARQALAAGVTLAGLASLRYSPPRMGQLWRSRR